MCSRGKNLDHSQKRLPTELYQRTVVINCKYLAYCFLQIDRLVSCINHTQLYCMKMVEKVQFLEEIATRNKY